MLRIIGYCSLAGMLAIAAGADAAPRPSGGESTLRVPGDYGTIQLAVDAAAAGDTIIVGEGTWCGAVITKRLTLRGEGQATITGEGCPTPRSPVPAPAPGEVGTVGFLLQKTAASDPSGTTIERFAFSNVYSGINAAAVDGVVVQHNVIQTQRIAVFSRNGSNWTVSHNRIDNQFALVPSRNAGVNNQGGSGWLVLHNEITGAYLSVVLTRGTAPVRPTNNTVSFNRIEGGIDGAGIDFVAQDGIVVTNNDIFVHTSSGHVGSLVCGAWGIAASDALVPTGFVTAINSTIVNNNTRDTQSGVVIALDAGGGAGNAQGLMMRGNLGTLALNQPLDTCTSGSITSTVKSRSITTLLTCDEDGVCR